MDTIDLKCPECENILEIEEQIELGEIFKCSGCNTTLELNYDKNWYLLAVD